MPTNPPIPISSLKLFREDDDDLIGEGSHGEVFKAKLKPHGDKIIAVKIVRSNRRKVKGFDREALTWVELDSPFVHKFLGYSFDRDELFLYSEYHEKGNVLDYMRENPLDDMDRFYLIRKIAHGMEYLHISAKLLHGDLKGTNILINQEGTPQISDFGLSRFEGGEITATREKGQQSGPIRWQAPERIRGSSLRKPVDIYALGMTWFEIVSDGEVPFGALHNFDVAMKVIEGNRPEEPAWLLKNQTASMKLVWDLIKNCWCQEPGRRKTIEQICQSLDGFGS